MKRSILILLCSLFAVNVFGQEPEQGKNPFMFLLPFGYDFMKFDEQIVHTPALGVGFQLGENDIPFTEVDRRFFSLALYRPLVFTESLQPDIPKFIHQIEAIFDGRLERHQLLFFFKSASDQPITGGLKTFCTGAGWGYEIIRKPHMSLILGGVLAISDFGITLPSGTVWPVLPLPLIRFGVDTEWFALSFEFLTGPNLFFTIAPKQRIRLTADMRMDYFRSITDVICEFIVWYRLFTDEHRLGDFAGIGFGLKNDSLGFTLSKDTADKANLVDFELQQTSIFAVIDFSLLQIQGGWIFDSRYIVDDKKNGSHGRGFFISIQGIIPIGKIN